jgi:hypothetical protein
MLLWCLGLLGGQLGVVVARDRLVCEVLIWVFVMLVVLRRAVTRSGVVEWPCIHGLGTWRRVGDAIGLVDLVGLPISRSHGVLLF